MTFEQELFILIVDKAALGILALIAGYWINKQFERFKSKQSLYLEIAREKRQLVEKQLAEFYWPILIRLEKDNAIWKSMLGKYKTDPTERKLGLEVEKAFILQNHDEIMKIIEGYIHHVGNNQDLLDEIKKYSRHVAVYKALRAIDDKRDPNNLDKDIGWPDDFYTTIRDKMLAIQQEYESLLILNEP